MRVDDPDAMKHVGRLLVTAAALERRRELVELFLEVRGRRNAPIETPGAVELAIVMGLGFNYAFLILWATEYGEREGMKRYMADLDPTNCPPSAPAAAPAAATPASPPATSPASSVIPPT